MKAKISLLSILTIGLLGCSSAGLRSPSSGPTLIDECYSAGDTDLDEAGGYKYLKVQTFLDERGYYANVTSGEVTITSKVPVVLRGEKGQPAWIYETPANLWKLPNGSVMLEMYRTNVDSRNPTGVNAHLTYRNADQTMYVKADRLECKK